MKKQKNFQIATLSVLAFAVLFMAIGFAAYSQTLTINGTANVKKSAWNIHWDNASYTEGTGTGHQDIANAQRSFSNDKLEFTFDCTLPEPGTFCLFTINAVNEGTYDANLSKVTMTKTVTPANDNLDQFFSYKIFYNGSSTPYTATTDVTGVTLNKGTVEGTSIKPTSHPVTVRVDYLEPTQEQYLPNADHTVSLTATFKYDQVATNGS